MSKPDGKEFENYLSEDPDWRQQQEQEEQEQWLDQLEQDKLKNLDKHLQRNLDELNRRLT